MHEHRDQGLGQDATLHGYGIGCAVRRAEDWRLLVGQGQYVDDVKLGRAARSFILRSPHPHARIRNIDAQRALRAPGVSLVLTGNDAEVLRLGKQRQDHGRLPLTAFTSPQPYLARDYVRYVGDPVAFIVAETLDQAKDAAELIEVEYEPLPAVVSAEAAIGEGAVEVWPGCPGNKAVTYSCGDEAAVDRAFARAAHILRHRVVINRVSACPLETRGCVSEHDPHTGRYTVRCATQAPHAVRLVLARQILHVPDEAVRVISESVGGSFGMKSGVYPEYAVTTLAAKLLGRPVRWIAERGESLLCDRHGRDNVTEAELALDADGKFLGLRVRTVANLGAYNDTDLNIRPATRNLGTLTGPYTIPAIHVQVIGVLTHTMLIGPYRGAGRPEAAFVIEALVDRAAQMIGIDSAELRARNTIAAADIPFRNALAHVYDSGDFAKNLELCLDRSEYRGFASRRDSSAAAGKLRGMGIAHTVVRTNPRAPEYAEILFDREGTPTARVGTHDHGQGHGTIYRQILAQKLGLRPDAIRFEYGDTDRLTRGSGTFGSRSVIAGGAALVMAAEKIIEAGRRLAERLLDGDGVIFDRGRFVVPNTQRVITLTDLARRVFMSGGAGGGLRAAGTYDGGAPAYPSGCHACEVEIDGETGEVKIVRYTAVDDVGRLINPVMVEAQIHGGLVQGVGQALMEDMRYDPVTGQPLSGSLVDYCMPRAGDFCSFVVVHNEIPTTLNPLGVKGAGEAGTVGGLAAAMNAINHALWHVGAEYVQMPATAEKVWRSIHQARHAAGRRPA